MVPVATDVHQLSGVSQGPNTQTQPAPILDHYGLPLLPGHHLQYKSGPLSLLPKMFSYLFGKEFPLAPPLFALAMVMGHVGVKDIDQLFPPELNNADFSYPLKDSNGVTRPTYCRNMRFFTL